MLLLLGTLSALVTFKRSSTYYLSTAGILKMFNGTKHRRK